MLGNQEKSDLVKSQVSKAPHNRSTFDLSHHHLTTLPFGYVLPFFKMESVAGDKITLRSDMSLNTFTLKSPILSNIRMKKDYINVPMEAILPFNWDKIFTNPVVGDDVPADCACTFIPIIPHFNLSFDSSVDNPSTLFGALSIIELVFSKGSLLSRLGYNLSKYVLISDRDTGIHYSVDDFVDYFYNKIFDTYKSFGHCNFQFIDHIDSSNQPVYVNASLPLNNRSDLRKLHRYFNEHAVTSIKNEETISIKFNLSIDFNPKSATSLNISPVAAYQISYAHYFSNDRVDYIYSAELYRQMMKYYCKYVRTDGNGQFELNGINCPFDYLSGYYINRAYENLSAGTVTAQFYGSVNYLQNLFGIRRSLRYLDYFTGSKVRPLGVGDISVQVQSSSSVSAVDVTRSIQMQRFLNFVNRTGRKFEEYVGKLSGVFVKPDFHNPQYLAHSIDSLYNSRVENTSDAQMTKPNSVTSTFVGDSRNFAFEFESDRPSIILGLVSFDIVRAYSDSIDRDAFHIDRYDYFNPFLQHIGDQPIYGCEFDTSRPLSVSEYFGYQTRHSEYKQIYNRADSGFVDGSLPSWAYINDVNNQSASGTDVLTISPENIRSFPEELDDFYLSLDGISLSKYFHFIVDFYNIVEAKRPMIASPNIL